MKNTALIIIDMQNDFVLPNSSHCIKGALSIVPNLAKVLDTFRKKSLPVFHVYREYREDGSDIEKTRLDDFLAGKKYCVPHTRGCEIIDKLLPVEGEYRIVKNRFSGFMNTELDFILRRLEIETIVVCGIQYPNCIRATIFDGVALGYDVSLITDATAAQTDEIAQANILDIGNIGVDCVTTNFIIVELEKNKMKETNDWNATTYNKYADFVSALGLPVVELLDPKKNEKILDLGCGDGTLAVEIEKSGASVIAVDLSEDMVEKAKEKGIETYVMSATQLAFEDEFDAVFSNAVLHWVRDSEEAVKNIHKVLKKGGRFVAEFGGHGNVHHIVEAMRKVFSNHPTYGSFDDIWFFPKPEEYAEILNKYGFEVEYIELIPRPTPIDDVAHWLAIFTNGITAHMNEEQKLQFRDEVREILKDKIYSKEEGWVADYVRLRVKAVKRV